MKPFDPSTYLKEVLGKAGDQLPDMFERYLLDYSDDDEKLIEARRAEVKDHWDKSKDHPRHGATVHKLLEEHNSTAKMTLLDAGARAAYAKERSEKVRQEEAAGRRKVEEWELAVDRWVEREGGLSPGVRAQLAEAAQHAGISPDLVKARLDSAPAVEAPQITDEVHRRQIAQVLTALQQDQGEPRLGLSLFHALGIEINDDQRLIEARHRELSEVNRKRAHAHSQSTWNDVLSFVQNHLIRADPRAYIEGLVVDIRGRLSPLVVSAVADDGVIDESEAKYLKEQAIEAGLTPDLADRMLREAARNAGASLRTGAEVDYVMCASCRHPHDRAKNQQLCHRCGEPLFIRCPVESCGAVNDADAARCSNCQADLRRYADARRHLGSVKECLAAGRLAEAQALIAEAEQVIGHSDPKVQEETQRVGRVAEEASALWHEVSDCTASRRLYAARKALTHLEKIATDTTDGSGANPAQVAEQVRAQIADAEEQLARGRDLAAAEREQLLASVLAMASDCAEARAELDQIAPKPPGGVHVQTAGQVNSLTWSASASPGTEYEVTRLSASAGTQVVGTTTHESLEDTGAEAGHTVHYRVVAVRGRARSAPVESEALVVIRDVTEASATNGDGEVVLKWKAPGTAGRVVVTRTDDAGQAVHIPADAWGTADRQVENGQRYAYLVQVEYPTSGGPTRSSGVSLYAEPVERPKPLADLRLRAEHGGTHIEFDPPAHGRVAIVASQDEPSVEPGAEIRPDEMSSLGRVLTERAGGAVDERAERIVWYLPVTVAGGVAVIGHAVRHVGLPAVENVKAEESAHLVRVTWSWPQGVKLARLAWRSDRFPTGHSDPEANTAGCRVGEYRDHGGFTIDPPHPGPLFISVYPAMRTEDDVIVGSLATKHSRASVRTSSKTEVRYNVRLSGYRTKKLTVTISEPGAPKGLPRMVLVCKEGDMLPHGSQDGRVLAAVAGGEPVEATIDLPRKRPLAVRLFVEANAAGDGVAIFDPPADDLIIGR